MLEIKHLRTIYALSEHHSIRKAADVLFMSLSALSHQIKELESRLNSLLFIRGTNPIEFTDSGREILALAHNVLPMLLETERKLAEPKVQSFSIGLACHSCFQWLIPIIERWKNSHSNIAFNFADELFEDTNNVDFLFTDDPINQKNITESLIGEFEMVAVIEKNHPLASKRFLEAGDFAHTKLITYPVAQEKIDLFKQVLLPANIIPKHRKTVKNSHTILQMVSAGMGVAVLPHWLVSTYTISHLVNVVHITNKGLFSQMYLRYNNEKISSDVAEQFVESSKQQFNHLTLTYIKQA
jgi:LysR family transcriptional regulator, regulator for metE and metH